MPASGPAQLATVGFVAQDAPVYAGLTVADHLRFGVHMNPGWDAAPSAHRVPHTAARPVNWVRHSAAGIARELHDIVAHHLSVVVLQAAGARASGQPADRALEKIEHSGRQALTEMRRLLGMLREPDEGLELTPQPGLGELPALAESVRAAGLPVRLVIDGDRAAVPAAVDVSAYRIVQEALTNVLKHAGSARAEVSIGYADDAVTIEVADDGADLHAVPALAATDLVVAGAPPASGRGLTGMRERVALFGGELRAGPKPEGGFTVRARLPLGTGSP